MKRIHGKAILRTLALALMLCCAFCVGAQADYALPGVPLTHPLNPASSYPAAEDMLSGGADGDTWLQVTVPYGTAQITFMQTGLEQLRMSSAWGGSKTSMHFANYGIYSQSAFSYYAQPALLPDGDFSGLTATVTLSQGSHLLLVRAGEIEEISERSVYGYWTGESWASQAPGWYVAGYTGCSIAALDGGASTSQAAPAWGGAEITVIHRSLDGTILHIDQQSLNEGYNTVYARYDLTGYMPYGETSHGVTVAYGTPSESAVTFYYQPQTAQVIIRYRTIDGQLLDTETRALVPGVNRVACARTFAGYTLIDNASKSVTAAGGQASPAEVTFYFQRDAVPLAAMVSVIYQAEDGTWSMLGGEKTYTPGTYTIYPDFNSRSVDGSTYVITGPQYYTVTVSANGVASLTSVTFRYKKQAAASSGRTVTATAKVYIRSGPGIDYNDISDMKRGDTAVYLDESKKANGVTWYKIRFYKNNREYVGWVSSKYAELD